MSWINRMLVKALPLVPRTVVERVASRYVAGEGLDDAIRTIRELNRGGAMGTVDLLGEEVTDRGQASAAVEEYLYAFDRIAAEYIDCNVSVKLTALGLKIDEAYCAQNLERLAVRANELGNFIRIDMEDHTCTDATLRIYHQVQRRCGCLGVVLQSMLHRTAADIQALPEGTNVRLCKGIYREPAEIAWQGYDEVRRAFVDALDGLLARRFYVAIATHDELLVARALELIQRYDLTPAQYEFQMLLGVTPQLRQRLIAQGHRLRVYVPYGRDWYAYSMRRLRENPTIARHIIRALFVPGLRSRFVE